MSDEMIAFPDSDIVKASTLDDNDNGHCQDLQETTKAIVQAAYEDALDDIHTRFVLNLPDEELATSDRIFFQLEQAFWFYDDFICDSSDLPLPRFKNLRPFAQTMFQMSPLLQEDNFDQMWAEFCHYKRNISTYGSILLNAAGDKIVLTQVYFGKAWTFPAGKVNQHETGSEAGARETYEETGFDPNCLYGLTKQMKDEADATGDRLPWKPLDEEDALVFVDGGKRRTLYVCRGVPENFPFTPVARKEVSDVEWRSLDDLPKKSFAVFPFIHQLRRWVKKNNKTTVRNTKSPAKKRTGSASRSRNNSRGRDSRGRVREDDPLVSSGLAESGEDDGWTEEDMFKTNEMILGRKITYDGSTHHFSDNSFDGLDPHAFHVVGGGFMNSGGGIRSLAPRPEKSRLQPLFRLHGTEDVGLEPFFGEDSPWSESTKGNVAPTIKTPKTLQSKTNEKIEDSSEENAGETLLSMVQNSTKSPDEPTVMKSSEGCHDFLTDAEVTARSQNTKATSASVTERLAMFRLQRAESQKRHLEMMREIDEWKRKLLQPLPTRDFGDFRFDTEAIIKAMEAVMVKS